MNQAMLGLLAVVMVILTAPRLGWDIRRVVNRLTLSGGLFCLAIFSQGLLLSNQSESWLQLWGITGSLAAAGGGLVFFNAVLGFSRTPDA